MIEEEILDDLKDNSINNVKIVSRNKISGQSSYLNLSDLRNVIENNEIKV